VSALNTSFTFRLTRDDKAALANLAQRLGCDRGAALRRMIRQSSFHVAAGGSGQFAPHGRALPLKLQLREPKP
jgi:hypothetical protein